MTVHFHPHAIQRMQERGAEETEVVDTVVNGEELPAKFNRTCHRKNFEFGKSRSGKHYHNKQIEAYCVMENDAWLVISVIVKYF